MRNGVLIAGLKPYHQLDKLVAEKIIFA